MGAIVRGSIADIARTRHQNDLARAWLDVTVVVLVDISASMRDVVDDRPAVRHAQAALDAIQHEYPGRVAVIAYHDRASVLPTGRLPEPRGGTLLAPALQLAARIVTPDMRLIIISDGLWQDHDAALLAARRMSNPIDGIYIGNDPDGKRALAAICAGRGQALQRTALQLHTTVRGLLAG